MQRKLCRLVAAAVAIGFMGAVAFSANAEDKKAPTSKEVMKAVNGKVGLCAKTSAFGKDMKWEDAAKVAKDLKEMGEALGKADPKKGDPESWKKLTKTYAERTEAISDAVEKKDAKALDSAVKEFTAGKNCMECHSKHK